MRNKLIRELERYHPYNEQEKRDREIILRALNASDAVFTRQQREAHMTASAWIVNRDMTKVLMVYHNLYDSWSWLGGHADGEEDLLAVALREAREESGILTVVPVTESIFSVEVLCVNGHEKRGEYISSHLHLNLTYLLMADESERLSCKPDENSGVKWVPVSEAAASSAEPWMRERIYPKLNEKLVQWKE